MTNAPFTKGDILAPKGVAPTREYHHIVYYEGRENGDFCGALITNSIIGGNISLSPDYFHHETSTTFGGIFENMYLVMGRFTEALDLGPFVKIGSVKPEGISFIEGFLNGLKPKTFTEYFKKNLIIRPD